MEQYLFESLMDIRVVCVCAGSQVPVVSGAPKEFFVGSISNILLHLVFVNSREAIWSSF